MKVYLLQYVQTWYLSRIFFLASFTRSFSSPADIRRAPALKMIIWTIPSPVATVTFPFFARECVSSMM